MIAFTDSGKGFPVIFLHGFCETKELWQQISPALSENYRIICLDLPGFGHSPLPDEDISIESVAHNIYQWINSQNIHKCIVIGHSLGGYITLALAEQYPDLLAGIGLFHSTALEDTPEKKANRNRSINFIKKHGVKPFTQTSIPLLLYKPNRERLKEQILPLIEIANNTSSNTVIQYTIAMRERVNRLSVLQNFSQPVLFIAGQEDPSIPVEKIKEQSRIPHLPICYILPEVGHMGMIEKPEESIRICRNFIQMCL
jgi:pimeloyl-ACP methyl ester carboxylesterase